MKKLLLFILLSISVNTYADNWLKATEFAFKIKIDNVWQEWSDWSSCDINIKIDFEKEKITIYSKEVQIYYILEEIEAPFDPSGEQIAFRVKDHEGDYGRLRFRLQENGTRQIYIDFNNMSWVYSIN